MTPNSYSYKEALIHRLLHKEGIDKINKIIQTSHTRYSISKYNEDENDSPQWCFSINQIINQTKNLQLQCINCILCGGYIERMSYSTFSDPLRLIKNIYCNDINHHNMSNKKNDIIFIKELLKLFYETKHMPYLYHASLRSILIKDTRLDFTYDIMIKYIGISFHPW